MRIHAIVPLLLALALVACAPSPAPKIRASESPAPAVSPTPTPAPPTLYVYARTQDAAFTEAIHGVADSAGARYALLTGAHDLAALKPAGRAAVIALLPGADADVSSLLEAIQRGLPVYAYAAGGQTLPEGLPGLVYDAATAAETALSEAIAYPPHDTPVRLLGLFESGSSDAFAAWERGVLEGRVFDKGAYRADQSKKEPDVWLLDALERYYPGMLDGIYCESAALTLLAADALAAENRDDLELFSASASSALLARMQLFPLPGARAGGANPEEAGRRCAEQALILLYGGTAQNLTITPQTFSSGA